MGGWTKFDREREKESESQGSYRESLREKERAGEFKSAGERVLHRESKKEKSLR